MDYHIIESFGLLYRCVKPYKHTYRTYCKQRWINKNIFEILTNQFKFFPAQYYNKAIHQGTIQINENPVNHSYILKNKDLLFHTTFRPEPPVFYTQIKVIYDLPNILVVDKPPSIPVHPTGPYNKNSLTYLLNHQKGYKDLRPIHRLDRLTSGIVILAKNSQTAKNLTDWFKKEKVQKWYVARVKGKFPYEQIEVDIGISCINQKDGIFRADLEGKISKTNFYLEKYCQQTDQSLVVCNPVTGRTHQIRVHLQYLGYPVVNDVRYGGAILEPVYPPIIQWKFQCQQQGVPVEVVKQMGIYLHAFKYKLSQNLNFEAALPDWALMQPQMVQKKGITIW